MKAKEWTAPTEKLDNFTVRVTERPDGSILLNVTLPDGKNINRTAEKGVDIEEIVRSIKFDWAHEAGYLLLNDAVEYCCSAALPTYTRSPLSRTYSSRLWSTRKVIGK